MIERDMKKKTAGAVLLFYFLFGFEILYMIGPFGLYYYSIYGKGLNFLNEYALTAWLCAFFLPHIATTSSFLLNLAKSMGWAIATLGFVLFCIAAIPVYYGKLKRLGPITGGLYKYIRHPQYSSLIICSFGLLLVWPRNFVMITFITMVFAYYFLAKAEERECSAKFGKNYDDYISRTAIFFPFDQWIWKRFPRRSESWIKQYAILLGVYLAVLLVGIALSHGLRLWSIHSLYTSESKDIVIVSLVRIDPSTMIKLADLAMSHPAVSGKVEAARCDPLARFIVYVMPAQWFMSDIPMNMNGHHGHHQPGNFDRYWFKTLVMRAFADGNERAIGKDLLLTIRRRVPLTELTIDLRQGKVEKIEEPPALVRWGNIPTPLY